MKAVGSAFAIAAVAASVAFADTLTVNGKTYECKDGVCALVADADTGAAEPSAAPSLNNDAVRIAHGYMSAEKFIAFLERRDPAESAAFGGGGIWMALLLALLGGLAANLTPCVLPLVPVNLAVIGRSAGRGAAYGLGIASAYGALGMAAAFGGMAFGAVQGSPWFNAAVAVVFALLGLSLFEVFFVDLSRFRPKVGGLSGGVCFPFLMGALAATLAGACVAPVLISVLLLAADWAAKGYWFAAALPLVMGVGMALPWPFVGAGMRVLPKPGAWMRQVNRGFGLAVLGLAVWYGYLAWIGFRPSAAESAQPDDLPRLLAEAPRPVLVDCWASWCKNCAAMDSVLATPEVRSALRPFTVIKVQAEDIDALRKEKGFEQVVGLPAFVVFEADAAIAQ